MTANPKSWEDHYCRDKSILIYPDENLVRILKSFLVNNEVTPNTVALDMGCGSGRHMCLLQNLGVDRIFGLDYSINALNICDNMYKFPLIQAENRNLPIKTDSIDIVVSWGSLHYCTKEIFYVAIDEINRIMKKGAVLFGTLRSDKDTFLKRGKEIGNGTWVTDLDDIKNSVVSFFNEKELTSAFAKFELFQYGIMERSLIGDIGKIISHWFFMAEK